MRLSHAKLVVLVLGLAMAGCSSSSDGDVSSTSFSPDPRTPAAAQVYLASEGAGGQTVTVSVRVRELSGIAAARLYLEYDPVRLVYRARGSGDLLEQGGAAVTYGVVEEIPGRLRVEAQRTSGGTATAGSDDPVLVLLQFQVVASGAVSTRFSAQSVLMDEQMQLLPGVTFFGGTFLGF